MPDLSTWNLTIPQGRPAITISTSQLQRDYRSDYFQRTADGIRFWVPVNGSHTRNSEFPRSELRATLKANDATINAERVRLSYTRITSPVSGKVGIRNVDVGNLVRVGDSLGLFSVTQIAPISVVFSLQQEQLPQLQALLGGEAAVRAYSRDGGSALGEGRLLTIDNQIDSSTGTIRVRASFDNRQARLWPGQFVAVSLHTGVRRDQLVLSSKAVRRGLEGNFVYRVAADRVEAVPVRVLQDIDGLSVVEGLASGDQVVVDGHSRLMPGALVDIQEPRPSLAQAAERQP
nr:efflux RND transporter periplasmic adaptor subunit [Pseudomonas aeruginosa]